MYNELKKSHKPYAKKILYELFINKICDTNSLCEKFPKKRHKIIKASIKDLEKCHFIQRHDKIKNNDNPEYVLSKTGIALIDTNNAQNNISIE